MSCLVKLVFVKKECDFKFFVIRSRFSDTEIFESCRFN